MSNAGVAEYPRVVIDDASFDFRDLQSQEIEGHLDDFNDALSGLRKDEITAWKSPDLEVTSCHDDYDLTGYLMTGPGDQIDPDTRRRFFDVLSKLPEWDASIPGPCLDASISGTAPVMAFSVCCALALRLQNHGAACLVFGSCERRGFVRVTAEIGAADLFFFSDPAMLPTFWRHLYTIEDVPESEFRALGKRAFPNLILHESLTFRKFEGTYQELRHQVVTHLGILNDHFLDTFNKTPGQPDQVAAALVPLGLAGISPASPQDHRNEKLMKQFDVDFNGRRVRCEWHTKIERHRNRIYFAFEDLPHSKILVGIFTRHIKS